VKAFIVTGGAGFIGSHLVDKLVEKHYVLVLDNFSSGFKENINDKAARIDTDITDFKELSRLVQTWGPISGIYHMGAIARTPWCIDDPLLAAKTNVMGTLNVLEVSRQLKIPRCVLSSSNVVYAAQTPYRATKEMGEMWGRVYNELYGVSNLSLRYSNVYGTRQSELGPSPNVFAALRMTLREKGHLDITGDGEQTRHYTHCSDVVRGLVAAMDSDYVGEPIDLCHPQSWSMNAVAKMFGCSVEHGTVKYLPERFGDIKHIPQDPSRAKDILGWAAKVDLPSGIKDCL
jgi:UDP-glucose 4-epimerase